MVNSTSVKFQPAGPVHVHRGQLGIAAWTLLWSLVAVVVLGVALVTPNLLRVVEIGSAYKAKHLCSAVFVAGRDAASVAALDLIDDLALLRWFGWRIEPRAEAVTASFLGLGARRAVYRPGLGCALELGADRPPPILSERLGQLAVSARPSAGTRMNACDHSSTALQAETLDQMLAREVHRAPDDGITRTRAVLVQRGGEILSEHYAAGIGAQTPMPGWSMAKTVMNALVGILVDEGRLTLEGPVPLRAWQGLGDARTAITVGHLLRMEDGLEFTERYTSSMDDVVRMLYDVGDAATFVAARPLRTEPGTRWSYSSGATTLLSAAVRDVLEARGEDYRGFPRRALFEPLGMASAVMEVDAAGTFLGSAFMYASARDWARLGQLYLQDGVWEGRRLLPEGWVAYTTTPGPHSGGRYGAHVWLEIPRVYRAPAGEPRPQLPPDAFHLVGHEGQFVSVIPSLDLVAVRLGAGRADGTWDQECFLARILDHVSATDEGRVTARIP